MTIYTSVNKIPADEKVLARKKILFLADNLHKTKTVIDYIDTGINKLAHFFSPISVSDGGRTAPSVTHTSAIRLSF